MPTFHTIGNLDGWSAAVASSNAAAMGPMELLTSIQRLGDMRQQSTIRQQAADQQGIEWNNQNREYDDASLAAGNAGTTIGGEKFRSDLLRNDNMETSGKVSKFNFNNATIDRAAFDEMHSAAGIARAADLGKQLLGRAAAVDWENSAARSFMPPHLQDFRPPSFEDDAIKSIDNLKAGVSDTTPMAQRIAVNTQIENIVRNAFAQKQIVTDAEKTAFSREDQGFRRGIAQQNADTNQEYKAGLVNDRKEANKSRLFDRMIQAIKVLRGGGGAQPDLAGDGQGGGGGTSMLSDVRPNENAIKVLKQYGVIGVMGKDLMKTQAFKNLAGPTAFMKGIDAQNPDAVVASMRQLISDAGGPDAAIRQYGLDADQGKALRQMWNENGQRGSMQPPTAGQIAPSFDDARGAFIQQVQAAPGNAASKMEHAAMYEAPTVAANYIAPKIAHLRAINASPAELSDFLDTDWTKFMALSTDGTVGPEDTRVLGYMRPDGAGGWTTSPANSNGAVPVTAAAMTRYLKTILQTSGTNDPTSTSEFENMFGAFMQMSSKMKLQAAMGANGRAPVTNPRVPPKQTVMGMFGTQTIENPDPKLGRDASINFPPKNRAQVPPDKRWLQY